VAFHVLIFALISWLLYQVPKGIGQEQVQTGGIVLVNADLAANEKPYLEQADIESPETAENAAAAAMGGEVSQQTPALDLNDLPDLPGMESSEEARRRAVEAQQQGSGLSDLALPAELNGGGKIGQSPVRFGGLVGTGSRFVYVVDRSGSMNSNGLMQAAKAELEASLNSLNEQQQFQVIFYNDTALVFNPTGAPPKMMSATKENIAMVLDFIRQTPASGGTVHMAALEPALHLGPDVIFLLTDADERMQPGEFAKVGQLNRSNASINVLVFGPTPDATADNMSFAKLARETRGQFVFKSTSALRRGR
jgi:Mg-chelatase subunit ChlD